MPLQLSSIAAKIASVVLAWSSGDACLDAQAVKKKNTGPRQVQMLRADREGLLARTIHEASAPGSCEHGLSVVG